MINCFLPNVFNKKCNLYFVFHLQKLEQMSPQQLVARKTARCDSAIKKYFWRIIPHLWGIQYNISWLWTSFLQTIGLIFKHQTPTRLWISNKFWKKHVSENNKGFVPLTTKLFLQEFPLSGIPNLEAIDKNAFNCSVIHRQRIINDLR